MLEVTCLPLAASLKSGRAVHPTRPREIVFQQISMARGRQDNQSIKV
jgi:hypothetical protein